MSDVDRRRRLSVHSFTHQYMMSNTNKPKIITEIIMIGLMIGGLSETRRDKLTMPHEHDDVLNLYFYRQWRKVKFVVDRIHLRVADERNVFAWIQTIRFGIYFTSFAALLALAIFGNRVCGTHFKKIRKTERLSESTKNTSNGSQSIFQLQRHRVARMTHIKWNRIKKKSIS